MNNFYNSVESFKINEAKKRMGTLNNTVNMNSNNSTNNLVSSMSMSDLPNLYNSTSVNNNEIQSAKAKLNNYSSKNTSQNSMY